MTTPSAEQLPARQEQEYPVTIGLLVLSGLAAVAWGRLEFKVSDPLVDVHAVLAGPVLRANLATVGLGWALFSSYLLIPQFVLARPGSSHYGLGAATAAVGLLMVPLAAGQTVAGPLGLCAAGAVLISAAGRAGRKEGWMTARARSSRS